MSGQGIRDLMGLNKANFSTVEKDFSDVSKRILANDEILRLLYFNAPDCLDKEKYEVTPEIVEEIVQQNLRLIPSIEFPENHGSFIVITFDSFAPNANNPEFIDNFILMDVISPTKHWMMDSYMMRPFRIMHELKQMFDDKPLNGIGKAHFAGSNLMNLGEYVGYQMAFSVINDD